ncbi:MBOAT family protein, partial [Pseudomonas sp. MWU13-2860]
GWLASTWVEPVFSAPETYHPLEVWAAFYAYAFQIYLDFSGYTDLVTALALLLGIQLPRNFDAPCLAHNLRDFWRRWHMSLSSWIRDYIYIPLGGNRLGFARAQLNLLAAMLLSGLWHGASLKYLVWGGMHGLGVVGLNLGDRLLGKEALTRRWAWLARLLTFHYVCLAWVFFRAASLEDGWSFLEAMAGTGQELTLNAPGFLALTAAAF